MGYTAFTKTNRYKNNNIMQRFENLSATSPECFKRQTGLSQQQFEVVLDKVKARINYEKERYPMSKRGRQTSMLTHENRLLLTLYYLRHYPTFQNLAHVFGISESYCCKVYHRYARILAHVEKLPSRTQGLDHPPETVIIDATEQAIERPVKKQRAYYSGKKSAIR